MTHPEDVDEMKKLERMFRQHEQAPDGVASPLYRGLLREWAQLHEAPSTAASVRRWARTEPALAGLHSPGAVVDAIDAAAGGRADDLLLALVRLFQAGHQLAGRTALQALLPCLARKAAHVADRLCSGAVDTWAEDRRHLVVAEFWDVMAAYPADRRRRSVAGNLVLETLRRVAQVRRPEPDYPIDPYEISLADTYDHGGRLRAPGHSPEEPGSDEKLLRVIVWGLRNGTISRDEAQLLVEVYMPSHTTGSGLPDTAARRGLTQEAVRQRCSRASRKLAAAVRLELAPTAAAAAPAPVAATA